MIDTPPPNPPLWATWLLLVGLAALIFLLGWRTTLLLENLLAR